MAGDGMKNNYGNRMPEKDTPVTYSEHRKDTPDFTYKVEFPCSECGGMNRHLRSCSHYARRIGTVYLDENTNEYVMPGDFLGEQEERWPADRCSYCGAPGDLPHHTDCPNE